MARFLGIALGRAGHGLGIAVKLMLAAGVLGAASRVHAEPVDTWSPPSAAHLAAAVHVSPEQAQLEAMKVEMAWLADVATYRLSLDVCPRGQGLEARGQVPDEASRLRALEVARQACYLPVHDGFLVVAPEHAGQAPSGEALRRSVRDILTRQFGPRAAAFDVQATDKGRVSLRGQVNSVEEKLSASRCLRGLPGCTSIRNCLAVTAIKCNGHTVTLVTTDGKQAIHGTLAGSEDGPSSGLRVVSVKEGDSTDTQPALPRIQSTGYMPPAPTLTLPSGLPARPVIKTVRHTDAPVPEVITPAAHPVVVSAPPPTVVYVESPTGYATRPPTAVSPQPIQALPATSTAWPSCTAMQVAVVPSVPPPSFWERFSNFRTARQQTYSTNRPVVLVKRKDAAPVEQKEAVIAVRKETAAPSSPKVVPVVAPATPETTPLPLGKIASDPTPPPSAWPPAHRTQPPTPAPAGAPFKPKPIFVRLPAPTIPSRAAPPPAAVPPAAAAPPVIHLPATVKVQAAARPAVPQKVQQPKIQPVSATAKVEKAKAEKEKVEKAKVEKTKVEKVEKAPPAPAPNFASGTASELHANVKTACGKLAQEVKVVTMPDHKLVVRVTTKRENQEKLIGVLLGVPAVAASNVKLEIRVVP
jgi:hypothetical protein